MGGWFGEWEGAYAASLEGIIRYFGVVGRIGLWGSILEPYLEGGAIDNYQASILPAPSKVADNRVNRGVKNQNGVRGGSILKNLSKNTEE